MLVCSFLNGPEPACSSMTSLPVSDKLQDGASMNMLRQWICCILQDTNLNISVNLRSTIVIKVS